MSNQKPDLPSDVEEALKAYLDAPTWSDKKRILETHQRLLLTDMRRVFELSQWIVASPEATPLSPLMCEQRVLVDSMQNGIDVAFSERRHGLSRYIPLGDELLHNFFVEGASSLVEFAEAIYREDAYRDRVLRLDDLTWSPLALNNQDPQALLISYPAFFAIHSKNNPEKAFIIPWAQIERTDPAPTNISGQRSKDSIIVHFKKWIREELYRFYFFLDSTEPNGAQDLIDAIVYYRNIFMRGLDQ